jgi:transcription elongation GreA/GreB family factor
VISDEFINKAMNDDMVHATYDSPAGRALLNSKVGEIVEFSTPSGAVLEMTVKKIE